MFAYSLYDYNFGNTVNTPDARSRAMGGTGVAGGYNLFDATLNPANISLLNHEVNAAFALNFMKNTEDRSLPMFNFFDSYIDNSTYSNNSNIYPETSFGLSYNYAINNFAVSAAAMFRPYINFDATYEEQVRNDANSDANTYPPIIANNYMDGSGAINAYSFIVSGAYNFTDLNKLALALEVADLNGSQHQKTRIVWTEFAQNKVGTGILPDSLYKASKDFQGLMIKLGTNYVLNERVTLGLAFQTKTELDVETTVNSVDINNYPKYIIPSSLKAGVTFQPRNPYKTVFQFDVERINYSEVNKFFDDSYSVFLGVEHYVGKAVPLRVGFRHESSMLDNSVTIPTISAGTGFPITKNLSMNISGEFSTRTYDCLDLFRDGYYNYADLWSSITPTDRGWENPDRVDEQFFKVQSNLCFTW